MNKILTKALSAGALFFLGFSSAWSVDLVGVYNQALKSDPTYKKAEADWLSSREDRALAMVGTGSVGTGLFPNVTGTAQYTKNEYRGTVPAGNDYSNTEYSITLTQPIFNWSTWSSIREGSYDVKSAYATYMEAGQALINNVANAYLEVLRANENLAYTIKEKEADRMELVTDLQKYKVGLIAVTGVYDAQSSYDKQIATEISDRNVLIDAAENLRALTGVFYKTYKELPAKLPTVVPLPNNMEAWVKIAAQQSYAIQSYRMSMLSYKQKIITDLAGVAPTLNAVGNYTYDNYSQGYAVATGGRTTLNTGYIGLAINFPIFRGGYTIVTHRQDEANYLSASDQLELTYRTVANDTRQSFLNIKSGISQIDADFQTILANEKQLEATQAAYLVGSRTMVDVLIAIAQLYESKKTWAGHRYDYLEALLQLKYDAGTLSPDDLVKMNRLLKKSITMDYKQRDFKKDEYYHAGQVGVLKVSSQTKRSATTSSPRKGTSEKAGTQSPLIPSPLTDSGRGAEVLKWVSKRIARAPERRGSETQEKVRPPVVLPAPPRRVQAALSPPMALPKPV